MRGSKKHIDIAYRIRSVLFRVFCKVVRSVLQLRTFLLRPSHDDPTSILVENFTNSQRKAAEILKGNVVTTVVSKKRLLIIAPFKDQWDMTEVCVRSLLKQNLHGLKVRLVLQAFMLAETRESAKSG